jgi:hypothetical protein
MEETYNGWANRETWAFYLHLSNEEGLWAWAEERTEEFAAIPTYLDEVIPSVIGAHMVEAVEELWDECEGAEWVRLMRSDVGSVWRIDTAEIGWHLLDAFVPNWHEVSA